MISDDFELENEPQYFDDDYGEPPDPEGGDNPVHEHYCTGYGSSFECDTADCSEPRGYTCGDCFAAERAGD